jgi:hypothetical protein
MGFANKRSHKDQALQGRIIPNADQITGDRNHQADGCAGEIKANLKQTGDKTTIILRGGRNTYSGLISRGTSCRNSVTPGLNRAEDAHDPTTSRRPHVGS